MIRGIRQGYQHQVKVTHRWQISGTIRLEKRTYCGYVVDAAVQRYAAEG